MPICMSRNLSVVVIIPPAQINRKETLQNMADNKSGLELVVGVVSSSNQEHTVHGLTKRSFHTEMTVTLGDTHLANPSDAISSAGDL